MMQIWSILNCRSLKALWKEVDNYWTAKKATKTGLDSIVEKVRSWYFAYYDQVLLARS
jgi:hypothetical protein